MMKSFSKFPVRVSGFALLFCLLVSMAFLNPNHTKAQVGSAQDKGIMLTIDNVARFDHGQRLRVDYTIHSPANASVSKNVGSPMESPHIWLGNTMVRGYSVSYKKTSPTTYKGTIVAQLHQYRPQGAQVTFYTYSILNERGRWKIQFYLEGI